MICPRRKIHFVSKKCTQKRDQDKKKPNAIRINIRHPYASSPSLHDPLVWDYRDTNTHKDEVGLTDKSRSVRVWGKIGLRHLEDQRLQMVRKEQGLGHFVAAQGQQQGL